ncbi:MAG: hypothetical protein ABIV94_11480 [Acidimicrobiales bacterium]
MGEDRAVRYFLGLLAAVALVAGATTLGYNRFQDELETRTAPSTTAPKPTGTTLPEVLPSGGQVVVVGTVSSVHLESALIDPLPTPLTITTPNRGLDAGATFTGLTVDGQDSSIHWDAGTPLQLAGTAGSIAVGAVTVDADGSTTVVTFGDLPQGVTAGPYTINNPVAVSLGDALPAARDTVGFTATATATVTFTGGAAASFPTQKLSARGPGKAVLTGGLTLVRPDGTQSTISSATLPTGPFTVELTLDDRGLTVRATLQGTVETTP